MERNGKTVKKRSEDVIENVYTKKCLLQWSESLTILDLREHNLRDIDDISTFPPQLLELNLSHNKLCEVPMAILNLEYLKVLDMSFNTINCFDYTPNFCHTIEQLNLSNNSLKGPPYWVFSDSPEALQKLDISNNWNINASLDENYIKELLQFNNLVRELHAYNCALKKNVILLQCFLNLKTLNLGTENYSNLFSNSLPEFPCQGLDKCCDIEKLNLCNTNIFDITPNICMYKSLKELDMSQNNIKVLPNEFGELINLEICILSHNQLLYLPEDICKLVKLKVLHVDSNKLCMMSEYLHQLCNLKVLDLFDNNLYEVPKLMDDLEELDLALNYFEEPNSPEYLVKKQNLRSKVVSDVVRWDGRKVESIKSENEFSDRSDDEDLMILNEDINGLPEPENRPLSSPEDWDSDDYWVPHNYRSEPLSPLSHVVRYEKLCNPQVLYESDGQFDDYSDDDT